MRTSTIIASTVLVASLVACEERAEDTMRQPVPSEAERSEQREEAREEQRERAQQEEERKEERAEEESKQAATDGAMAYLPADCKAVARIDMPKLLKLPGAKEHVVPALEKTATKGDSRLGQVNDVLEEMGVQPTKDVREIAMCAKDLPAQGKIGSANVVVAASGDIPEDKLVPTLLERSKNGMEKIQVDGAQAVHDPKRDLFVAQTKDGTVVAARTRDALANALTKDEAKSDYQLPGDKAASMMLPSDTIGRMLKATDDAGLQKLLADAKNALIELDAEGTTLTLRVEMPDEKRATELGGVMKTNLERLRAKPEPKSIFARNLDKAQVTYEGAVAVLEVPVPEEQVETLMRELANEIRTSLD